LSYQPMPINSPASNGSQFNNLASIAPTEGSYASNLSQSQSSSIPVSQGATAQSIYSPSSSLTSSGSASPYPSSTQKPLQSSTPVFHEMQSSPMVTSSRTSSTTTGAISKSNSDTNSIANSSSTGSSASTSATRVQASQIPNVATSIAPGAPRLWDATLHTNPLDSSWSIPPPISSHYCSRDFGNCRPRFMRPTLHAFPCNPEMLSTSGPQIPLAIHIQPLADLSPEEGEVPLVDFSSNGPPRCNRCRAYINPFATFVNGGRQYQCKFCDLTNEVPNGYFSPLEVIGKRADIEERPELSKASVDFLVSSAKEYYDERVPPQSPLYLFAIDVSFHAVSSGLLASCCQAIRALLTNIDENLLVRFGVVTFDTTVHFYNLSASLQQPQMLVIPDINDVFLPIDEDHILVSYRDSKANVNSLLDKLPSMFQNTKLQDSAFGAAIQACSLALRSVGGKLLVFQATSPTLEPGKLKKREELLSGKTVIGTDKEKLLYTPQDSFYQTIATECAKYSISINLFLCPPSLAYLDLSSIEILSHITAGQVYYFRNGFNANRDFPKLQGDLLRNMTRTQGFQALMRIRTSPGITISSQIGNFCTSVSGDEIILAAIDSDKSFCVELKHDNTLEDKSTIGIQCALLYTTTKGERRVRVHNLLVSTITAPNILFRAADCEAILVYLAKNALLEVSNVPFSSIRTRILDCVISMLSYYRKFCATSTSSSQLVLPDNLKLLVVYILALSKQTVMRPGSDVNPDERAHLLSLVRSLPPEFLIALIYPRVYALHQFPMEFGIFDKKGNFLFPPLVRLCADSISHDGAYLLEDGQRLLIWLGRSLASTVVRDLFDINGSLDSVNLSEISFRPLSNELSFRVHNLINEIRKQRHIYQQIQFVKQGDINGESLFRANLVEESSNDAPSYVDFLCQVHRQIQTKCST